MRQKVVWALALAGLGALGRAEAPKPSAKAKERLGEATLKALTGATKVEVFRVDPRAAKGGDKAVAGYPVKGAGEELGAKFATRLGAALQDDATLFGTQARCFTPGVGFRLHAGKETVEVAVCFACSNLRLVTYDAKGKEVQRAHGAFGGPGWGAMVKLAKEAFPDDKEIQALKDKR